MITYFFIEQRSEITKGLRWIDVEKLCEKWKYRKKWKDYIVRVRGTGDGGKNV